MEREKEERININIKPFVGKVKREKRPRREKKSRNQKREEKMAMAKYSFSS